MITYTNREEIGLFVVGDKRVQSLLQTVQGEMTTLVKHFDFRWLCWFDTLRWAPKGMMGVPWDQGRMFMATSNTRCSPAGKSFRG